MEPTFWWIAASGAAIAFGAFLIWLFRSSAHIVADIILESFGSALQVRWEQAIQDRLNPIEDQLADIEDELTLNGGNTVKDGVWLLRQQMDDLQAAVEAALPTIRRESP